MERSRVPSEPQLPVIHQTEIDGVPALWSPVAGPLTAALQFRVGRVDEPRPIGGITHLVEHLAFTGLMDQEYELSGFVEPTRTVFHATGHPHEVTEFLARICANLADLPLDRLAHERRVLVQEANERPTSIDGQMRWFRYGPHGHGLSDGPEFGLDWLGPEPIDAWRRSFFTRGNAMLVLSGEPPPDLRLTLPEGSRRPPVLPVPDPDLPLPAFASWEQDAVCMTLVGERSPELTMVLGILERRLKRTLRHEQGTVYDLAAVYGPLTGTVGHLFLGTECARDQVGVVQGAMIDAVEQLATDGPTDEEIAREIDGFERMFLDPTVVFGLMDTQAQDMLLGQPIMLPDEGVARRRAATTASVKAAAASVRVSALLASSAVEAPAGFHPAPLVSKAPVRGREVAPAGFHLPGRRPKERLIVGDEGVTLRFTDGGITTVLYERAVLCEHGSPTLRRLTGHDGFSVVVDAEHWKDGPAIVAEIDRRVDPLIVSCEDDADNAGWARRIAGL
jgi:predicted Zn-dependent peptidase